MKYIIALIVAVCIAGAAATHPPPPINPYEVLADTILDNVLKSIISSFVGAVLQLVIEAVPVDAVLDLPVLIALLSPPNPPTMTIAELTISLFALLGADGSSVLEQIPPGVLALAVDLSNLLNFIKQLIPPTALCVTIAELAPILMNYFIGYLFILLKL